MAAANAICWRSPTARSLATSTTPARHLVLTERCWWSTSHNPDRGSRAGVHVGSSWRNATVSWSSATWLADVTFDGYKTPSFWPRRGRSTWASDDHDEQSTNGRLASGFCAGNAEMLTALSAIRATTITACSAHQIAAIMACAHAAVGAQAAIYQGRRDVLCEGWTASAGRSTSQGQRCSLGQCRVWATDELLRLRAETLRTDVWSAQQVQTSWRKLRPHGVGGRRKPAPPTVRQIKCLEKGIRVGDWD